MGDLIHLEDLLKGVFPNHQLLSIAQMEGGVSTRVWGIKLAAPHNKVQKFVLREETDKSKASNQFELISFLYKAGLPVPQVFHQAEKFGKAYLIMEWLDAKTDFQPQNLTSTLEQLAQILVKIHSLGEQNFLFLPNWEARVTKTLSASRELPEANRQQEILTPFFLRRPKNANTLLHGDFWPGNTLWKTGKLRAVIDWEDAVIGDPLLDLANLRLELLWAYGHEAMQQFTAIYRVINPSLDYSDLPYWDLFVTLHPMKNMKNWGLEPKKYQTMHEGIIWFNQEAFDRLGI